MEFAKNTERGCWGGGGGKQVPAETETLKEL